MKETAREPICLRLSIPVVGPTGIVHLFNSCLRWGHRSRILPLLRVALLFAKLYTMKPHLSRQRIDVEPCQLGPTFCHGIGLSGPFLSRHSLIIIIFFFPSPLSLL